MKKKIFLLLALVVFIFFRESPKGEEKKKPLPSLLLNVPRALKAPKIDGVLEPGEWETAVSWPAGGWHYIDARKVQFFLLWDEDFVYVGQKASLLPGETIIRIGRQPKPDVASSMETEMEVFIDAGTNGSNRMPCTYQVIANACGRLWDVEQQWTIGQHNTSWNGDWIYAQKTSPDKKYWTAELAIPRKTIYFNQPLKDGITWRMGFARDGGRQPNGIFGCVAPVTFREKTVVVQFSGVEKCVDNKMAFTMRILNPEKTVFQARLKAKVEGGSRVEENRDILVPAGKEVIIEVDKSAGLKQGEKADFFVELSTEKETIFRWAKPIYYDDLHTKQPWMQAAFVKPFDASVVFNPVRNFLRVKVDRFEFPEKEKVNAASITVKEKGGGKILATGTADNFFYDLAETKISLPADLPAGEYEVTITLVDKNGSPLQQLISFFTRKDLKEFPWFGNDIGISDRVLWPFLPLTSQGRRIQLWEREVILNNLALPVSITSKGRSLLSGAIRLWGKTGGEVFALEPAGPLLLKKNTRTVAEFAGKGNSRQLVVETLFQMEYDGCSRVELKLQPSSNKVALEKLCLEIPFYAEQATHFHTFRQDMRVSCYAGLLPSGEGKVWDSTQVPANQMTVGSFVPLIFLGTPQAGLTWFADSDENWWPTDSAPAAEIIRQQGEVILRFNLAAEPVVLSSPRTIVFGLHISPVRPLVPESWTPGSGICGLYEYDGRFDRKIQKRGFYLYPAHPDRFNAYYTQKFGGRPMGVYTENAVTDVPEEDAAYFADEWEGGRTKSLTDCCLYYAKKLLQDCPIIHGFYIDNIYPRTSWNVEAGSAYRLPDGRIQPGFDIWQAREYVKRLRTLLQDMKRQPHGIEVHMTGTMVIPVYAWADCMREGENPVEADQGKKDFADLYPAGFCAIMNNPYLWGINSVHHWMFYTREELFQSLGPGAFWKAQRTGIGQLAIHGNLFPRPSGEEYRKLISCYDNSFRSVPGGETFIPYWENQGLFQVFHENCLASLFLKPDRLALWVMNYSRKEEKVTIWLDLPRLLSRRFSEPRNVTACDLETMEPIPWNASLDTTRGSSDPRRDRSNQLTITLPARDFRIILIR